MTKYLLICLVVCALIFQGCWHHESAVERGYNEKYIGEYTRKIAFPIGGIGTGMFCIEGTGALSNMSIRHRPNVFNEPTMFAAIHVKGYEYGTRILEGPVPEWKKFGAPNSSRGDGGSWGMPRFKEYSFQSRFPFAEVELADQNVPIDVKLVAWNPFIPTDEDNSSLPVAGFEYEFHNTSNEEVQAVFSYNSMNFMQTPGRGKAYIDAAKNGFILRQTGTENEPFCQGDFMIYTDNPQTVVNHNWFRGGWFDPLSICWDNWELRYMCRLL